MRCSLQNTEEFSAILDEGPHNKKSSFSAFPARFALSINPSRLALEKEIDVMISVGLGLVTRAVIIKIRFKMAAHGIQLSSIKIGA